MSRLLSLTLFVFGGFCLVLSTSVMAQDDASCKKCQTNQSTDFELVGVDFPIADTGQKKTACQQAEAKKNEISIRVECDCEIPFLNSLPIVSQLFNRAPAEECEIFVLDDPENACCGICKDGCDSRCEQCEHACCPEQPKGIQIELSCEGESPLLKNIPFAQQLFRNGDATSGKSTDCQKCDCQDVNAKPACPASTCGSACEVVVFESSCEKKCGTCKNDCPSTCEPCESACCPCGPGGVAVEFSGDGVPFLSNVPYVNRMFTNVGIESIPSNGCPANGCSSNGCSSNGCSSNGCPANGCPSNGCPSNGCPSADETNSCPVAVCGTLTCETPACRTDALLQLASHHGESIEPNGAMREEFMQRLMEVQVENARLEATVEAMEHHMELMEEMYDVRAENAVLKSRLEMMERHKAEHHKSTTTSFKQLMPQSFHGTNKPYVVMGMAHPPHAAPMPSGPHGKNTSTVSVEPAVVHGHAAMFASEAVSPHDMQRVAEQVRKLQKELELRHGKHTRK